MILCPNCQHKELPGALFCSECGAQLISLDNFNTRSITKVPSDTLQKGGSIPEPVTPPRITKSGILSIALHIIDSGQVIHLAERKDFSLGRAAEYQPILPDVDLSPYDAFALGVSRLHAR